MNVAGVFRFLIQILPLAGLLWIQPSSCLFAGEEENRSAGGIVFDVPETWKQTPPASMMRLFQFQVPARDSRYENGEMAIFYFGSGQGGNVNDNIARWQKQFSSLSPDFPPEIRNRVVSGMPVTLVHLEGVYQSGMPGTETVAKENYAVLGAIAQGPQGSVFFKMTGPIETLRAVKPDFEKMTETFRL